MEKVNKVTTPSTKKDNKKTKHEIILEMKGITKIFPGVKALDRVDITLRKGAVTSLMGENGAGKSTIMKSLFGIHKIDEGKILYEGKEVSFKGPKDALDHGIAMVHQELNQVQTTTVMDNIWLGRMPKKGPLIDEHKMFEMTMEIFNDLDIKVDPKLLIEKLSVSEKQMVEIAKAVSFNSKVLILDEPTSSLTEKEVSHLFRIIRKLLDKDVAIAYISHKMSEIFEISDYITVFRDGKLVSDNPVGNTNNDKLVKDMVGRDLKNQFPERSVAGTETILKVENFSSKTGWFEDVNFELKEGEILGIAGLVGSGRTEVLESMYGLMKVTNESRMYLRGKEIFNKNTRKAIDNGFAMITEERKKDGIFGVSDIRFNTTIAHIDSYKGSLLLNNKKRDDDTERMIANMDIKTPSKKTKISSLSGGNQQKVIIGRWLLNEPDIMLMDEPTRGIDVGAKYKIYELMQELSAKKKSIVVVSSEMQELQGVCHRILVMSNNRLAGIVDTSKTTQEEIMQLASKYY